MIMSTADMLIHVRPELDAQVRNDLERKLMGRVGVDCAEFEHKPHPHSIMVKYDPDEIAGMAILQVVRKIDPNASRVGM
jgi:hypothetical protein